VEPVSTIQEILRSGVVIPALPLALTADRKLDERRQRGLCRYYAAAGAGGIAVGVHTTQFEIRDPKHALLQPVLALAAEEMNRADAARSEPLVRVAGVCGRTEQAVAEALQARELGYHFGLLSLTALAGDDNATRLAHCRTVAKSIPLFGFYLQRSVGGPMLSFSFWRQFAEIEQVAAIKIAPFNRYQTIDVVRAVAEAQRDDVALYTGNDDQIVLDLVTPFRFLVNGVPVERRIVGGLLGHWSVWTHRAVELVSECHAATGHGGSLPYELLRKSVEVTDCNAAFFDAAHGFSGCIVGLHEVLRRQGLLAGTYTLDPGTELTHPQRREIDRVYAAYPHLNDDAFIAAHRDEWLRS
jgi:dihydrodipicolinate synthase/N-acetylneuraminate lyase